VQALSSFDFLVCLIISHLSAQSNARVVVRAVAVKVEYLKRGEEAGAARAPPGKMIDAVFANVLLADDDGRSAEGSRDCDQHLTNLVMLCCRLSYNAGTYGEFDGYGLAGGEMHEAFTVPNIDGNACVVLQEKLHGLGFSGHGVARNRRVVYGRAERRRGEKSDGQGCSEERAWGDAHIYYSYYVELTTELNFERVNISSVAQRYTA
jgi:hypothetical protein